MIKVRKNNVVLRVSEEQLQAYLNDGYSKVKVREKKEEKNDSETKGGKK